MNATDVQPRPRGQNAIFWILLAVVAGGAFFYVLMFRPDGGSSGKEGPAIGRRLPYLQLQSLTGAATNISLDDLAGRVTVVNYWGTWCPPCQREFPHIVDLAERFAKHPDFRLYAVSCDGQDDANLDALREETEAFLKARDVSLPTYADPNRESRLAMVTALGLNDFAYPTTMIIDRQGTIRGFWVGYERGAERVMQSLVEELLNPSDTEPAS